MADETEGRTIAERQESDRDAAPWLEALKKAEVYLQEYHERCDRIEKTYARLKAGGSVERELQIFWANLEVMKPAVYSRPPIPVVTPRYRDMRPIPRAASEILERSVGTAFELDKLDRTMRHVRDDFLLSARSAAWIRYETANGERVRVEHLHRLDFRHEPARKWAEVGWVARRAWLTRRQLRARFAETADADTLTQVQFQKRDDDESRQSEEKAAVWEIWSKTDRRVIFVSEGAEKTLDEREPWLDLEDFWPCPEPVYGTVEPGTLKPVPDYIQYQDQLDEINELTARISALAESLRLKGFYASGAEEVGDAIERVMRDQENRALLVPVPNGAAFGGAALKDAIVWLPVREVAETVKHLVELRRQMIEDVYQVTGISDIVRGDTDPNETLGAQQIKSQWGSIRIRDRQAEMVRFARDITRTVAECMAETFSPQTLMAMSQYRFEAQQMDPAAQAPQQGQQPDEPATLEAVIALYREQRLRPFVLDIETDSTIQPDEDAEKQRRIEFLEAVGGFMERATPLVQGLPQSAEFVSEALKFTAAGFRAGRELEGAIERFADQIKALAAPQQGEQPPDPETIKAQAEAQKMQQQAQLEQARFQMDAQREQFDAALKQQQAEREAEAQQAKLAVELQAADAKLRSDLEMAGLQRQKLQLDIQKAAADIERVQAQTEAARRKPEERRSAA